VSSFPFIAFMRAGREKKAKIKDEAVDAVYPFLIAMQTNKAKKTLLTLAFLSRKGHSVLLGGQLALEMQLPMKDIEPDPEIEIRTSNRKEFRQFTGRLLTKAIESEFTSKARIVEDHDISQSKRIGLLQVSRPEKLLVDALAEKQSCIFVETVAETIANSDFMIDVDFLKTYAESRGVLKEVLRELEEAKESGFP
ncbi:MAG: hypothetical protein ACYCPP_09640, partial [Nitrososphaerales archaeon]